MDRVRVPFPVRDRQGKVIKGKFTMIEGECYYEGYNEILNCYQVTVGRTPVFPVNPKHIERL